MLFNQKITQKSYDREVYEQKQQSKKQHYFKQIPMLKTAATQGKGRLLACSMLYAYIN